jgi:hypothetical protein
VGGRTGLEKEAYGRLAKGIWTTNPFFFWLWSVSFVIRAEVADEMGYRVKEGGPAARVGSKQNLSQETTGSRL